MTDMVVAFASSTVLRTLRVGMDPPLPHQADEGQDVQGRIAGVAVSEPGLCH